ncbi:MAG: hypothetical protein Q8R92_10060 [Deltaproteobacteria bacterium]|nr:hypothetical protein [Deltaproteobacteria bacterium]
MSRPARPSDHRRYFRLYEYEVHEIHDREVLGVVVALYAELNARKAHLDGGAILLHPTARMTIAGKRTVAAADRLLRRALAELGPKSGRSRADLGVSIKKLPGGEWRVGVRNWQQKQGYPPTQRQPHADETPPPGTVPGTTDQKAAPRSPRGQDPGPAKRRTDGRARAKGLETVRPIPSQWIQCPCGHEFQDYPDGRREFCARCEDRKAQAGGSP